MHALQSRTRLAPRSCALKWAALLLACAAARVLSQSFVPNEIILKLSPSASALQKDKENSLHVLNAQLQTVLAQAGKYHVATALPEQFPMEDGQFFLLRYEQPSLPLPDLIVSLAKFPEIEYAQFNHILRCEETPPFRGGVNGFGSGGRNMTRQEAQHATMSSDHIAAKENSPVKGGIIPNDSLFIKQWALATLRAVAAWKITTGSRDILVAVIDTGVRSRSGLALSPGEGDALGFAPAGNDLKHVLIYPNPFLAARHAQLTIAGLTESATIAILDEQGRVLIALQEKDGEGGYHWDTRNAKGELLPSGVYVCYITSGKEKAWAKFVIVR